MTLTTKEIRIQKALGLILYVECAMCHEQTHKQTKDLNKLISKSDTTMAHFNWYEGFCTNCTQKQWFKELNDTD